MAAGEIEIHKQLYLTNLFLTNKKYCWQKMKQKIVCYKQNFGTF